MVSLGLILPLRPAHAGAPRVASFASLNAPSEQRRPSERREPTGRPKVKLNRLTFPSIPQASYYKNHLQRSLHREALVADWGAGEGSVIEYRFRVDRLEIETEAGLVRVHCAATGELPRGKNATSQLTFSGDPAGQRQLVEQVLAIVARGVITRLAQIEHARRRR